MAGAGAAAHRRTTGAGQRMTTRVLLVDDDALIRAGLRAILDAEPDLTVVGEAADGAEVPAAVARVNPHVVVMDVRMPAIDGIQATRQLLTLASPPVVLVLTTFENDDYVYEALRAGASGFLLKRARPAESSKPFASSLPASPCSSRLHCVAWWPLRPGPAPISNASPA